MKIVNISNHSEKTDIVHDTYNECVFALEELKRRIDITRRARFACSTRLREYSNKIQNLIVYYNILVVFVSIVTLYQFYNENAKWTTFLTLALSITLSFFATHIGGKNYKEKAIMMESNGHDLSKIYGKIEMLKAKLEISPEKVANLYKEYERTLVNVENHENVDYIQAKIGRKNKDGTKVTSDKEDLTLEKYHSKIKKIFFLAYVVPFLVGVAILIIPLTLPLLKSLYSFIRIFV